MGARILVVEDHPTMRAALVAMLEGGGHQVVATAADGREALRAVADAAPDLVVLDLHVPVVSGEDLLRALIAGSGPATRVLVVTADGGESRRASLAAGASGYLTKPFGPDALLREAERVLRTNGSPATSG